MLTRRPPQGAAPVPEWPSADPSVDIAGTLVDAELPFDGGRRVTAWLPPSRPTAVVLAGDGQAVPGWARTLASAGVASVALVGVHSLPEEQRRLHEYSPGFDPSRFAAHEDFITGAVLSWARHDLGLDLPPRRTAVFGASAGGELALALGVRHPDLFGRILCASPGAGFQPDALTPPAPPTYLVAGSEEPFFLAQARGWAAALDRAGGEVVLSVRAAGHGDALWRAELPLMARWAFDLP